LKAFANILLHQIYSVGVE
jgi:hypothetical protein